MGAGSVRTSFGTSCEPRSENKWEKRRRQRHEKRQEAAASVDPFERIVALCTVRDRSCAELRKRLAEEGLDEHAIEEAIDRGVSCGLLDDARFADGFARGRVSAGKGRLAIERDLLSHDIDPERIEGWPEAYGLDDHSQLQRAIDYLVQHPPKAKDAWSAAFRKLVSRGYSPAIASSATRAWAESRSVDE